MMLTYLFNQLAKVKGKLDYIPSTEEKYLFKKD